VTKEIQKRAFGFGETATMFGISRDSVKRLWRSGYLATITIGGRRLVPLSEIERIEREGIGTPRTRKSSGPHRNGGRLANQLQMASRAILDISKPRRGKP